MPHGWTIISGTPDELADLWDDPQAFKKAVYDIVTRRDGAALDDVYFAESERKAYVLIHFGGKPADADEVLEWMRTAFVTDKAKYFLSAEEKAEQ